MAACPVCRKSFSLGFLSRTLLSFSLDPWAAFCCPRCGAALRPRRGWLFVVNFSSTLPAVLLMQAARDRGVGLAMQLIGFAAIMLLLRILLAPLFLRFTPREAEGGARGIHD
jgi:hypothetical protein